MSTAELKEIIDQQTAEELKELARRRSDLLAGRRSVSQAQAEKHWNDA